MKNWRWGTAETLGIIRDTIQFRINASGSQRLVAVFATKRLLVVWDRRIDAYPPTPRIEEETVSKEEYDARTGGLHPAVVCGEDCSGCCDEWEWK